MQYSSPDQIAADSNDSIYIEQSNIATAYELQAYTKELTLFEVVNLDELTTENSGITLKASAYDKIGILFILQNSDGEVKFSKLTNEEQQLLQD